MALPREKQKELLAGSGGCGLYTDMKTSDDWTDERLLDAMVIEGKGLIADIPLQIEQN